MRAAFSSADLSCGLRDDAGFVDGFVCRGLFGGGGEYSLCVWMEGAAIFCVSAAILFDRDADAECVARADREWPAAEGGECKCGDAEYARDSGGADGKRDSVAERDGGCGRSVQRDS